MTKTGASLEIRSLRKAYGGQVAVEDVSVEVAAGEFVTLLGASGSGKTTTLMMVAGFVAPDQGDILLNGRSIRDMPPEKRDIGVVFQSYALFPHLSVLENVAFPLRMRRLPNRDVLKRAQGALDLVELGGFVSRKPAELSGGQQQRVALARAIVFEPPLLLMDEPLGALDRKLRESMQSEIKHLQTELGLTVLYVTHDQEEALTMSDRIAIMADAKVQQIGTPPEVYENPASAFIASFLGESNFIDVRLERVAGDRAYVVGPTDGTPTICATLRSDVPSHSLRIMIRPESIRLLERDESDENVVDGTVRAVEYLGASLRVQITTPLGPMLVRRARSGRTTLHRAGEPVRIGWSAADTHMFSA